MGREYIDGRAVSLGALSGASLIALLLSLAGDRLVDPYNMLFALSIAGLLASGLAGAVAGYTSRIGMVPMQEGAIAATVAFCLGITLWIAGQMVLSPLHPADTALVLLFNVTLPLVMVFPFCVILGAFTGERALFAQPGTSLSG